MIRGYFPVTVRSAPITKSGTSQVSGNAYSFLTVQCLDEDYNKFDATLADDFVGHDELQAGAKVTLLCDVSPSGKFQRVKALSVAPKGK